MKKSPHELLFGSKPRTRLPEYKIEQKADDTLVRQRDASAKEKMKAYADRKRNVKETRIRMGDTVLVKVKQLHMNELSSIYDPVPYEVTSIKGSMVTATRNNKAITRNSSFFKRLPSSSQSNKQQGEEDSVRGDVSDSDNHCERGSAKQC